MNERGVRPYCRLPAACAAGTRGLCRVCRRKKNRADAIVARYLSGGLTMTAIGARFGISHQRVSTILERAGVRQPRAARSRVELTPDQRRRLRTMCAKGVPAAFAHEEVRR